MVSLEVICMYVINRFLECIFVHLYFDVIFPPWQILKPKEWKVSRVNYFIIQKISFINKMP